MSQAEKQRDQEIAKLKAENEKLTKECARLRNELDEKSVAQSNYTEGQDNQGKIHVEAAGSGEDFAQLEKMKTQLVTELEASRYQIFQLSNEKCQLANQLQATQLLIPQNQQNLARSDYKSVDVTEKSTAFNENAPEERVRSSLLVGEIWERASTTFEDNNYGQALNLYGCAIEVETAGRNNAYILGLLWNANGRCYYKLKIHHEAIDAFSKAIDYKPNDALFYFNRSQAYNCTKEVSKAQADIDKAIKLNPKFKDAKKVATKVDAKANVVQTKSKTATTVPVVSQPNAPSTSQSSVRNKAPSKQSNFSSFKSLFHRSNRHS